MGQALEKTDARNHATSTEKAIVTAAKLIRGYVNRPREILGLEAVSVGEGSRADLVLFDPNAPQSVAVDGFYSLGHNSPFIGESLLGTVRNVFVSGEIVEFA